MEIFVSHLSKIILFLVFADSYTLDLFHTNKLKGLKLTDIIYLHSNTLLKSKYPKGFLEFSNGIIERSFKITIFTYKGVLSDPAEIFSMKYSLSKECFEEAYIDFLNGLVTLDINLSMVTELNQENLLKTNFFIIMKCRRAKQRQSFDEYFYTL